MEAPHLLALVHRLDAQSKEATPDLHRYYDDLQVVVQAIELTDNNLKLLNYHILKLSHSSPELSSRVLQELLLRLVPLQVQTLLEQAFIALVWILTNSSPALETGSEILFDTTVKLGQRWQGRLSQEATHAALILIWRKVDSLVSQNSISEAEKWCHHVVDHPIFQSCTAGNKGKFERKQLSCAVQLSDISTARRILSQISDECKSHPLTVHLIYKLALLDNDMSREHTCLESLKEHGAAGVPYLLSCAVAAYQSNRMKASIDIIEDIVTEFSDESIREIVRFSIQSLTHQLEDVNSTNSAELVEQTCRILDIVLERAKGLSDVGDNILFSLEDLQGIAHDSYYLAIRLLLSKAFKSSIQLIKKSTKFAKLYEQSIRSSDSAVPSQIYLARDFVHAVALVSQVCLEDAYSQERYNHEIRVCVQRFRNGIHSHLQTCDEGTHQDWIRKYRAMILFDFEAASRLGQWDTLVFLIDEAKPLVDDNLSQIFVDVILSPAVPVKEALRGMRSIVQSIHPRQSPYLTSSLQACLPRHLRCLFQLAMIPSQDASQGDRREDESADKTGIHDSLAEYAIDQALSLADRNQPQPLVDFYYPDEELEWMAAMAFNHAVDLYIAAADEDWKRWVQKAISLADLSRRPGTSLGRLLRNRMTKLI
ncbi:hypothetical protein ASPZODRAFT_25206 [Penicilliopsis zonata CBS 506.65]|uniref:Protein ZIP4 homolog n=1 Tax=Penicilliopsis zonata CBS 506.65 TaxID=1073090 RepID=A0A1L9SIS2_9EURO|nr:hypothetical protein ASPZODRAFT_25206 [Penicilliopsis zonata CBS 506.65]OJJ47130.1 hypothetical protein ASPZODRAFT_25206 [Penicilliopsis zonata CBS 506.65]